jgi:hypothetical protein
VQMSGQTYRVLFLCTGNSAAIKQAAFVDALTLISRRVDLLLSLPVEKLDRLVVEARVQAIGEVGNAIANVDRGGRKA